LRQISTSRSAQLTKAPIAQIVMICHRPPSAGARTEAVGEVGRRDVDQPGVERALHGGAPEDQDRAEGGEEDRRDPEEAHVERPDPEVEQVAADQRPAPDAVFSFETEQCHASVSAVLAALPFRDSAVAQACCRLLRAEAMRPPPAAFAVMPAYWARGGWSAGASALRSRTSCRFGAEQDEVDHHGQQEQEDALGHEDAAGIEDQPDLVEL
jgi:hypothetical protein